MRGSRGWLCAGVIAALASLGASSANGEQSLSSRAPGGFAHEPILVVEPAQWLLGFEQEGARREVLRAEPMAATARLASELRFTHLGARQSAGLARSTFPQLVTRRAGGLPPAPRGGRLGPIISAHAVAVTLPGGKHGAIESLEPISVKTSSGQVPVDLSLREAGGGYSPKTAVAGLGLEIPRTLSNGPALRDAGVSLVPVDSHGVPLASAGGVIDGATVFYGDSERASAGAVDMDTLVKPETLGFSEEAILRSERSPESLSYRIGMPRGARLIQHVRNGAIEIRYGGRQLATVSAPAATDAAGTDIPLSVRVSGDILTVGLQRQAGQYQFPIAVDPYVTDGHLNTSGSWETNWHFATNEGWEGTENAGGGGWTEHIPAWHSEAGYGSFTYQTQKQSSIFRARIQASWNDTNTSTFGEFVINAPNHAIEGIKYLPESSGLTEVSVCALESTCEPASTNNTVSWESQSNGAGSGHAGENVLKQAWVEITQTAEPTVRWDTTDATVGGVPNALYGSNWLGHGTGIAFIAEDAGIGIRNTQVIYNGKILAEKTMSSEGLCFGLQCPSKLVEVFNYNSALKDGSVTIGGWADDSIPGFSSGIIEHTVKVDGTPPHNIVITGLPSNHQINLKAYTLKAEASDGSGTTESSGIASIALDVDGRQVGAPSGSCSPGPCTAKSGLWTINGSEFSSGAHALEVIATDKAGNVAVETVNIDVPSAHPVALGPGEVEPRSGEFLLGSTDVSQGEGLSLARAYGSRDLEAGLDGPLGSQWSLGLGGAENIEVAPNGNVELTSGGGHKVSFVKNGSSGYTSPTGDSNVSLSLHEAGSTKEYILANSAKGTSTKFTLPGGGGSLWVPTIQEGQLPSETTTYSYETIEVAGHKMTRPTEALAPEPAGVSCKPTLVAGCRALTFNYATSTTATGEGSSEWGDYNGNLTRVYLTYYQPVSKTMATTAIAQYSYDAKGRLRAEWDPRISPALKTEYGYDSEGHITALTQPGEETWGFVYGTTAGDTGAGRIVKATHAPASATLWSGSPVSDTSAPEVSGTPVVGNRLAVSNGRWSGSPVVYGYQWEDCNSAGAECKPIPGATNPNYTPVVADAAYSIVVQVSATNGDGSVIATSAPSAVAAASATVSQRLETGGLTSVSCVPSTVDCVVTDSSGNAYYATNVSTSTAASWKAWSGPAATSPSEAVDCPSASLCLLADGKNTGGGGSVYSATSLGGAWTLKTAPTYGILSISCPNTAFCGAGGTAAWDRWTFEPTGSWSGQHQTPYVGGNELDAISCLSSSFCVTASSKGEVYVANTTLKIESSEWIKTDVDGTRALQGIACVSSSSCVAVDAAGNAIKLAISAEGTATATTTNIDGSNSITAITCTSPTTCVAVDNQGKVLISFNNGETWSLGKQMGDSLTAVSCSTQSLCVATDTAGVVQAFNPSAEIATELVDLGNSLNAISCRAGSTTCVAADSKGKAFYASNATGSSKATWQSWSGPLASSAAAVECTETSTCLMATNGELYYSTSLGGSWTVAYKPTYGVDAVSCASASFCVAGQSEGFYRYSKSPASTSWTAPAKQGLATIKAVSCVPNETQQFCAMGDSSGNVHIATTTAQIESGTWKETNVDTVGIVGISCVSSIRCTAIDSAGNALKMKIVEEGVPKVTVVKFDEANTLTGITCTGSICVAVDNKGNVFTGANWGETWSLSKTVPSGLTSVSCESSGHCFATDTAGDVQIPFASTISQGEVRAPQPGLTVEYGVPVSGTGAPYSMTVGETAKWSQSDTPVEAMAIFPADEPTGWPASDYRRASVYYFDERQRQVNTASPTGGIATVEYNEQNDVARELSADDRAVALAEGSKSAATSLKLDSEDTYSSDGAELLSTLGPQHTVKLSSGEEVPARLHTVYSYDEGAPEGGTYRLVTKMTEGAQLESGEQDVRTTINSYSGESNIGWRLREPTSVITDPSGLKLTKTFVYDPVTGNVTETRNPGSAGEKDPHDTVMVYYTAAANGAYPECGSHPEWANLPCETTPGAQPGTSGLPELPTTVVTYNDWLSKSSVKQTSKSASRTWKYVFDEADRLSEVAFSSTQGTSLPTVKYSYEAVTGLLNKETTTVGGTTKTLTRTHNTRAQLSSYTDADGNTAAYEYDVDGRTTSINDGKGVQTYTYGSASGLESEMTDTAVGKVTATYDVEGNPLTETSPDGITTKWVYNAAGEAVEVNDTKSSSCGTSCTWFSQAEVSNIHEQTAAQAGTLAQGKYSYDQDGRLTEISETPTGQGCTTRLYGYDAEGDMTGLTTRVPGAEGKCASSGGTLESHTYDVGNRLTGSGIKYDEFGDTTALPAADAGGSELLSGYYLDGQLASVSQAGQTVGYGLDPSLRTREVIDTGTRSSTAVEHYASGGDSPAWTVDLAGNWTRYISGIGGELIATQSNGETPTMQLSNVEGDVVATASSSPTATALLSTVRNTEFGVPTTTSPPMYSWLGAAQRPTELPSGLIAMGARGYVPQIGRFLQPDPRRGGSDNPYGYANDDPLNESDLSGEYIETGYMTSFYEEQKERAVERRIAEEEAAREAEEAAREEAERKAEEAAEAADEAAEVYAGGGGGKGKKGKKGKVSKNIAMYHDGGGPAGPKYKKIVKKIPPNKKCEDGEVKVGQYCEKGPEKGQRPDPPIPPPGIIGEAEKDAEVVCDVVCPEL